MAGTLMEVPVAVATQRRRKQLIELLQSKCSLPACAVL